MCSDKDLEAIYRRAGALIMPIFFGPTNIPPLMKSGEQSIAVAEIMKRDPRGRIASRDLRAA